eukprot:scaffold1638_cov258-Pinguiococcus_pyrenoidosus.AAC.72
MRSRAARTQRAPASVPTQPRSLLWSRSRQRTALTARRWSCPRSRGRRHAPGADPRHAPSSSRHSPIGHEAVQAILIGRGRDEHRIGIRRAETCSIQGCLPLDAPEDLLLRHCPCSAARRKRVLQGLEGLQGQRSGPLLLDERQHGLVDRQRLLTALFNAIQAVQVAIGEPQSSQWLPRVRGLLQKRHRQRCAVGLEAQDGALHEERQSRTELSRLLQPLQQQLPVERSPPHLLPSRPVREQLLSQQSLTRLHLLLGAAFASVAEGLQSGATLHPRKIHDSIVFAAAVSLLPRGEVRLSFHLGAFERLLVDFHIEQLRGHAAEQEDEDDRGELSASTAAERASSESISLCHGAIRRSELRAPFSA